MAEVVYCGNCGHRFSPEEAFCPQCSQPREADVATTLISADTPTQAAAICLSCGHPRKPEEKMCPHCQSLAPVVPGWDVLFLETIPANVPTPPLRFENPTPAQVYNAMLSEKNPYAPWGKLVFQKYIQPAVAQPFAARNDGRIPFDEGGTLKSFGDCAIQAQVSIAGYGTGLLFRLNEVTDGDLIGYSFTLQSDWEYRLALPYHHIMGVVPKRLRQPPYLLGVVLQGNVIDLYLNLQHLERTYDSTITYGGIGVCSGHHKIVVRGYQVWEK